MTLGLVSVEIRQEHDVVLARRRALQIARLLGFESQDQIRIATAVSELARNVFEYARSGQIKFAVATGKRDSFIMTISDTGPGIEDLEQILHGGYRSSTGMGLGLKGAKSLVDRFSVLSNGPEGTCIELVKFLPGKARTISSEVVAALVAALASEAPQNAFEEMQGQNQELIAAITEVERQCEALEQLNKALALAAQTADAANRAKTDFLANISHEIRTPMTAIIGLSDLLARTKLTGQQGQFVSILRKSAESMNVLVNDLLDISKIEDGKIILEDIPFSLIDAVNRVVEISAIAIGKKGVEIRARFATGPADRFIGDPQRLHQILLNLVSNAVKFTSEGSVTVEVEAEHYSADMALVQFHVKDTGIGIAQDKLGQIFEKFVQADASTTRRFGGSGLGLSIAKNLTELMGGRLSVTSRLGQGSTFSVSVPLGLAREEEPQPTRAPIDMPSELRILLVDDHHSARMITSNLLMALGHRVDCAVSGIEAIGLFENDHFDLVLMDIHMAGLDGFDTASRLRLRETETRRLPAPIFALTAERYLREAASYAAAGINGVLTKPLNAIELQTAWNAASA